MKRLLKWLGILFASVVAVVVLFVLSGYLLPSEVTLELEETVDAPPEALFTLFTTYEGVEQWWRQAALDMGDELEMTHLDGPREGVGMKVGFGAGGEVFERWSYVAMLRPERVEIEVDFQIFVSHRVLELTPKGTGTTIHWREIAPVDSPIWRWMLKLTAASSIENRHTALRAAGAVVRRNRGS